MALTIEEVRAKRAELAAKRAAAEAAAADAVAEATERRALADDEARDAANAELGVGKWAEVVTPLGIVILKKPHRNVFVRFRESGSSKDDDLLKLVQPSVFRPSLSEFQALLDELPAVLLQCADACCRLCGVQAEADAKKF